jgi:hypothetical protein
LLEQSAGDGTQKRQPVVDFAADSLQIATTADFDSIADCTQLRRMMDREGAI